MINSTKKDLRLFLYSTLLLFLSTFIIFAILKYGIPSVGLIYSFLSKKEITDADQYSQFIPKPIIYSSIQATNSAEVSLSGKSFIDGKVIFFLNGKKNKQIETAKNKEFSISLILNEGENNIYAVAQNNQGRNSNPSDTLVISLKTTPPLLEILSPTNGSSFFGEKQKKLQITGKTDENSTVFVNDRQVIVQKEGNFTHTYHLWEGENKIKIIVYDAFGNKTENEISVFYAP